VLDSAFRIHPMAGENPTTGKALAPEQVPNRDMTASSAHELPVFGTFCVAPHSDLPHGRAV
jgi:hypothetical protein